MPTHLDSIFFHWSGPSLVPTRLSATVSGVDCLSPSSVANCPLLSPFVSLCDWCPLTTSGHVEIAGPKPFVWFRAKTDKGIVCLADHQHSVTFCIEIKTETGISFSSFIRCFKPSKMFRYKPFLKVKFRQIS